MSWESSIFFASSVSSSWLSEGWRRTCKNLLLLSLESTPMLNACKPRSVMYLIFHLNHPAFRLRLWNQSIIFIFNHPVFRLRLWNQSSIFIFNHPVFRLRLWNRSTRRQKKLWVSGRGGERLMQRQRRRSWTLLTFNQHQSKLIWPTWLKWMNWPVRC